MSGLIRLKDIAPWPPVLTDTQSFKIVSTPVVPATLRKCAIYSAGQADSPYLSIVVDFQGRPGHAMIRDLPEPVLRRIEATLQGHEGKGLAELGDLPVVEAV